jgi:hypothetical protein
MFSIPPPKPLGTHRFQRALGKHPISFKLASRQEHAGSDAYPGAIFILSGRRNATWRLLERVGKQSGKNFEVFSLFIVHRAFFICYCRSRRIPQ